jgi:POT family proton-dependent oligopeptide transporter
MWLIPELLDRFGPKWGPHVAFGTPGLFMLLATWIFWLGRKKFAHIPPAGNKFVQETFNREGLKPILNLLPIYLIIAVFWSLYDQSSSAWVEQAKNMNRIVFGHEILASQVQVVNPLLVLIYVPLFTFVIYPALDKVFRLTPLRKMSIGFFFTVASFLVPAWVETRIQAGFHPTIAWHLLAYMFLMASEVMVYATGLEFSYKQAPPRMKSIIMSLFLATNTAGNLFTAAVNFFIQNKDGTAKLAGASYYLFFAGLMFAASLLFIVIAIFYRGRSYIQDGAAAPA